MNITFNTNTRQISSIRTSHFAAAEENAATSTSAPARDQITISQEGRDHLEVLADKAESQLNTMTKKDFMDMVKQWQSENQTKLEVDPYREVDPDGSIARKTYFESYLGQLKETEDTIKSYYADAYKEAVSAPINSLTFISGKYLCDWSDFYDPSIPKQERLWTYNQLHAMLTDSHVALNDPYALAAVGGPKNVNEMDAIAKQSVKDKLDSLLKEKKTTITD